MVEYRNLVRILEAPLTRVIVARSALAANGIESFIQSEITKTMDPFITGSNCLEAVLVCGEDDEEDARQILNLRVPVPPPHLASEREREQLEALGKRVRWATCYVLTMPLGAIYGFRYIGRRMTSQAAPSNDLSTVFAAVVSLFVTMACAALALSAFR